MLRPALDARPLPSLAGRGSRVEAAPTPTAHPHILVVDEDPAIRQLLSEYLRANDFRVTALADGAAMRALLGEEVVDLVLLGLKPGAEIGVDLARRLRDESAIPIVILSARSEEADRIMALELGADDYMAKPFSARELLARVRAILRRRRLDQPQHRVQGLRAYRFDGWELNLNARHLTSRDGLRVELTNGEFSLLVVLLGAGERVLSRMQLLELSRLHDDEVYNRAVDMQIMRLRRKLGENSARPRCIVTVRGTGYRMGVRVEGVY
jgi:two-component system, OmpR family, response regulator